MNAIKRMLKRSFSSIAFFGLPKIIVASTGRCGSTLLFCSIADSLVKERFHVRPSSAVAVVIKKLCTAYVNQIAFLPTEPALICKTHDTYEKPPRSINVRYVFIYGDPLDSAISVEHVVKEKGQAWFALHQLHLKATGAYDDLYEKDVLNYRGQLESWLNQSTKNILCIDYEDLWDEKERLSEFLGVNLELPARRARRETLAKNERNMELFSQLRALKRQLKQQYELRIAGGQTE